MFCFRQLIGCVISTWCFVSDDRLVVLSLIGVLFQTIDWLRYLRLVFNNVSISVHREEEVVLYATQYMKDLDTLIFNTDQRYNTYGEGVVV